MREKTIKLVFISFVCLILFNPSSSLGKVIAETEVDLLGSGSGQKETNLGNLIADCLLDLTSAEFSFVNAGSIGEGIPKGKILPEDIERLSPYLEDTIVILKLEGRKIRQALERSVQLFPKEGLNFLQVSGLSFSFDPNKKALERVVEIVVQSKTKGEDKGKVEPTPLKEDKTYQVVTLSFLARGEIGYYRIFNEKDIISETRITLKEALIKFLQKKKRISSLLESRITKGQSPPRTEQKPPQD